MNREKVLAANWKLNLPGEGIFEFCRAMRTRAESDVQLVVAPPFPFLDAVAQSRAGTGTAFHLASQTCSQYEQGAYTGEVSAKMIAGLGATYAIIGHSERRTIFGESDDVVGQKLAMAYDAGLIPIFCVGESQQVRDEGKTLEWLGRQVRRGLEVAARTFTRIVVAYEPIWAIGTGRNATTPEIREAHQAIESFLRPLLPSDVRMALLYGGSVKPDNAGELFALDEVDGFLVGGASLTSKSFLGIYEAIRTRANVTAGS